MDRGTEPLDTDSTMTQEEIFKWFKKLPGYSKIVEVFGKYDPELAYAVDGLTIGLPLSRVLNP